jgi:hypothetical protein
MQKKEIELVHTDLLFFKVVEGLVPALPPEQFITPQKQARQLKSDPARDQTRTLLPLTLSKTTLGTTTDALLCHAQTLNSTKTHSFQEP